MGPLLGMLGHDLFVDRDKMDIHLDPNLCPGFAPQRVWDHCIDDILAGQVPKDVMLEVLQ